MPELPRQSNRRHFRKRPVVIEAVQWTGDNGNVVGTFLEDGNASWEADGDRIVIHTLEGSMAADPGDWIIRGVKGEFYPCKPDIFDATYEPCQTYAADVIAHAQLRHETIREGARRVAIDALYETRNERGMAHDAGDGAAAADAVLALLNDHLDTAPDA